MFCEHSQFFFKQLLGTRYGPENFLTKFHRYFPRYFLDSRDPIFNIWDAIFNHRDPNRVPETSHTKSLHSKTRRRTRQAGKRSFAQMRRSFLSAGTATVRCALTLHQGCQMFYRGKVQMYSQIGPN